MKSSKPSTKDEKIAIGRKFIESLNKNFIMFAGITGSVSYNPGVFDDIDIFLVAKRGMAWLSIMDALLKRRMNGMSDICISLIMDENYAGLYFRSLDDRLIIRDSLYAISVYGEKFYKRLLQVSPPIASIIGKQVRNYEPVNGSKIAAIFNFIIFIALAPPLILKSIYNNFIDIRSGGGFDIHFSLGSFYLDSYKYRMLRQNFKREDSEDDKIFHINTEL